MNRKIILLGLGDSVRETYLCGACQTGGNVPGFTMTDGHFARGQNMRILLLLLFLTLL